MKQETYIKKNLQKGVKVLFIVSTIIVAAGFILEIISLADYTSSLLVNNAVALSVVVIACALYIYNKKNLKLSFSLIIYIALGNIIYGTFANEFTELRLNFFLRDSLFVMLFLTLAALVIHKRHALIIASIYLLSTIAISFISDNFFMKSSLVLIIVAVGGYAFMIKYFVGLLVLTIEKLEEDSLLINKQSVQLETKNEELVKINKTKDKFISILAHDLRNPFNTILGFSELLMTKFDTITDEEKKDYLHSIQLTSEKTFDLLNKLLDWARSQSGSGGYNPEKITLDILLKENLNLLAESAINKGISMKKDKDVDYRISADKDMVNTIIRNLLSNAIKFTPEKGIISAACYKKNDAIILEVKDTGIGMNSEELEQLFNIDRTISRAGTSNESGSGLGLLLCKEFTEKCSGKISAESEVGKGSSFFISFPEIV